MATPSWMQEPGNPRNQERDTFGSGGVRPEGVTSYADMPASGKIRMAFRVAALVLGVLMCISSIIELANLHFSNGISRFFIALYNILFAGILMVYEAQPLAPCEGLNTSMRHYFGLIYGHIGRAVFVIFIAFLNFALSDAGGLPVITGLALLVLGGLMLLIYFKYPHLLDDEEGTENKTTQPGGYAPPPSMPSTDL